MDNIDQSHRHFRDDLHGYRTGLKTTEENRSNDNHQRVQATQHGNNDCGKAITRGEFGAQAELQSEEFACTGQPGNSVSGVGAGILYRAPSDKFRCIVSYGYGFNAIRGGGRGANSISFLMQIDLDQPHGDGFKSTQPDHWRGWNWLLGR